MDTSRRRQCFQDLEQLLNALKKVDFARRILIGGSFVSSKAEPNDIDCIIAFDPERIGSQLRPFEYNVFSGKAVRRMFNIDAYPVIEGTPELAEMLEFFQETRDGQPVGLVEVMIHD